MNEVILSEDIKIEDMIYEIRGKQVMFDSDLAKLYHCKNGTKEVNQAVKNNLEKFPERFSRVLTYDEWNFLRSKKLTLEQSISGRGHHRKYLPRVFTEHGVAMLATILKTPIATQISIRIMDAFINMRNYIGNSDFRMSNIESKIIEHDNNIRRLQETLNKLGEKKKINEIYFNGQIFDAYSKILDIFKNCKNELIIIDAYADNTVLDIVKRLDINVTIITKKDNLLTEQDISKYNKQYNNLKVIFDNSFHDRYFILDKEVVYHCGASINRIGYKTFSINLISDEEVCKVLIDRVK